MLCPRDFVIYQDKLTDYLNCTEIEKSLIM